MNIVQLNTIEEVYIAYNDVKDTFFNFENEVNLDEYLYKVFQYGKVFASYDYDKKVYCGFAAVYMNDIKTKTAYISLIGVSVNYKGQHIGTELLSYIENEAALLTMKRVLLEVKKSNKSAIAFYKKNNYAFIDKETETSWFMIKTIE